MNLAELKVGDIAVIEEIKANEINLYKHILDMGLTKGVEVTMIKMAPLGDPIEIKIRGYSLTIRKDDAKNITVRPVKETRSDKKTSVYMPVSDHPRKGERKTISRRLLNESEHLTFALVGNQNSGKTTLFNQLTGSNQHVGNFPGVTVDAKSGTIINHPQLEVVDLPGIYSLSPYTSEEIVTREFILKNRPDAIINIIDATNIERNLYLTLQLLELGCPMVIALNMMDEVKQNHGSIDVNTLEAILSVPVVPISAIKNEGINELVDHLIHVALDNEKPDRIDFCPNDNSAKGAVHRTIHSIEHIIEDHAANAGLSLRFAASKLAEKDELIQNALDLAENERKTLNHLIKQMEDESGMEAMAAVADMRFAFIENLCAITTKKPSESKERLRSVRIDSVLTGKYTSIPAFIAIMALVFYLTFGVFGNTLSEWLETAISILSNQVDSWLTLWQINPVVHSLIIDGIFSGIGSVLSFLPIIVILFVFLSILEDSGYMARVAFVMDKILRKIGLSGCSFVPMLIGFGCSVPAIMATRTLPSRRDRIMTILLVPFMSCSAKLPIYALFTAVFFPEHQVLIMLSLYLLGIVVGIIFALLLKNSCFKGEPVPFVMELPNYRLPGLKSVYLLVKDKAMDFITRAFTVIFIAAIIIWFLESFDIRLNYVADSSTSILANIGGLIAPIFRPLGFDDWRISTALITGFSAKESVVSTLGILVGDNVDNIRHLFTTLSAYSFLVFTLLYTPCVATIATIKKELGSKMAVTIVIGQCAIAYLIAFLTYNLLNLIF